MDKKNPLAEGISVISYKLSAKENFHFQFSIEPSKNQGWFFMLKKDKNATASQLPNGSQNNESNQNEYSDDRDGLEISDERRIDYFFIDNIFVEEEFDVYTMAYYMRIVRRAHNSHKGFIEFQATTCKALNISKSKIIRCNALLEFCNIIKIILFLQSSQYNF